MTKFLGIVLQGQGWSSGWDSSLKHGRPAFKSLFCPKFPVDPSVNHLTFLCLSSLSVKLYFPTSPEGWACKYIKDSEVLGYYGDGGLRLCLHYNTEGLKPALLCSLDTG